MSFNQPNADVCQVLLTFHEMELVKGDMNGHCLIDNINIFGMTNIQLPHLCGPLSKQHMYLEFGRGSKITFSISIDGFQDDVGRKWNVQVSYIRCNDPFRAPSGCLQYYTASTGTVKMLGYPEIPHLAGLQYTICVRRALAAESIFVRF
ncbi:unnamed protein product [Orchesella dallaii]|uniref:CUB domain-containing protein n=1 Tax=Orchesella dallaii TaxID=48710 RepID=A0ABP1QQV2_9HEXA